MKGAVQRCGIALSLLFGLGLAAVPGARAQDGAPPPVGDADAEEIVVIGVTPTEGSEIPADRLPTRVQVVRGEDLVRSGSLGLTDYMNGRLSGVSINAAQNNPLQPDVQYRGFTASPLLGLPQGLAIYQNGVRINEPLGDAVNWDLIPQSAIDRVGLMGGANPLFGLNTLGGALSLQMKDGFRYEGHEIYAGGGSFGRFTGGLQSGGNDGTWGYYLNAEYFDEDGWRDLSQSDAVNLFGVLSLREGATEVDLELHYADTDLRGNGSAPETLLDRDYETIFTAPDITANLLYMGNLRVRRELPGGAQLAGNLFWRRNETDAFNGDASEFEACDDPALAGLICEEDEDDPVELGGLPADFDPEDYDAINNISDRSQDSQGGSLQWSGELPVFFGRPGLVVAGVSYFEGQTREFRSRVELSSFDGERSTDPSARGPLLLDERARVASQTASYSSYFASSWPLTDALNLFVAGRYNWTRVQVADRSGESPEVDGDHRFARFNPSIGLSWALTDRITGYLGYGESSRAPTPIELSCNEETFAQLGEDEEAECRLPNAFLADPPLDQVVARSFEAGLRGETEALRWSLGAFHSENRDDILFQSTGRATGVFRNVEKTRRWGVEAEVRGEWQGLEWFASYSFVKATFEDGFSVRSPNHPFATDEGRLQVRPGDSIPGTPEHRWKAGAEYALTERLSLGVEYLYSAEQFLRGDESNQLAPVNSYARVSFGLRYEPTPELELSLRVENALDREYASFGLLGEEAEDLPGLGDVEDVRFLGAGSRRGVFARARYRW